jgi:ADP-ribose pyrophosphatase
MADRILADTRFLRMIERSGWFFVERPNSQGVVSIVPLTAERCLVFVEQFRIPLGHNVIEFPAGLIGDEAGQQDKGPLVAAGRELVEETGFSARNLELVASTATSPGMANELVHIVLAWNLERVAPGGGIDNEAIVVHEIPLDKVRGWLRDQEQKGLIIAAKVFAGLYFADERWG